MKWLSRLFPFRARVRELERRVAALEKQRNTPAMYNEYTPGEMVPLGQLGTRIFQNLPDAGIIGRVEAAKEILNDEDNASKFTLWLETTEGVFCRTIEQDAVREWDKDDEEFKLVLYWKPIKIGKTLTVLDSAITYRDKVMKRIYYLHGTWMEIDDELRVRYEFTA